MNIVPTIVGRLIMFVYVAACIGFYVVAVAFNLDKIATVLLVGTILVAPTLLRAGAILLVLWFVVAFITSVVKATWRDS